MKILKSIWKSKEAPRDENFLWLKFEEGAFNLYTKGQTGWEIIKGVPGEQLSVITLADSFSDFSLQTKANAASQLGITEDELDAIIEGRATIKKGNYIMRVSKREIISQTNVICTYSSVSINIYSTTLDVESSFLSLSKEGDYYNAIYNSGTSTVAKS